MDAVLQSFLDKDDYMDDAVIFCVHFDHEIYVSSPWTFLYSFDDLKQIIKTIYRYMLIKNRICWPKFSATNHFVWNLLLNLSLTFIYFWPESCLLGKCLKIMFAKGQHWDKIICQLNEIANWWFSDSSEWTHNRITIMRKFLCAGNW